MSDIRMPRKLTAENGAKAAFSGEFFIETEVSSPDYCDYEPETWLIKIPVPWSTVKQMYDAFVSKYGEPLD